MPISRSSSISIYYFAPILFNQHMTKRTALLILIVTLTGHFAAYSQEKVPRTNYLANVITERFSTLKNERKERDGEFRATFKGNTVARGKYTLGRRTGNWDFYDPKGKLVQTFNYDIGRFIYLDTLDLKGFKYMMDNITPADTVTVPFKIGGSVYGLFPLLYRDELSQQVRADNPGLQKAQYTHIITVNDKGYIISHKVTAVVSNSVKTYTLDDSKLDPDLTRFTPATVNHKPAMCQISINTTGTFNGALVRTY